MSNLFLKNNIKNNSLGNTTESTFNASKVLNYNNKVGRNISATSSMLQKSINNLSSTSYDNSQVGGGSITSSSNLSKINSNDINNLLSMLTSESNTYTTTENLENKLINLLNHQKGGNYTEDNLKHLSSQDGRAYTEDMSTEMIENRISNIIKQSGGGLKTAAVLAGLGIAGTMASKYVNKKNKTTETTDTTDTTETDILANTLGPKPTPPVVQQKKLPEYPISARSVPNSVTSSEMPKDVNISETSVFKAPEPTKTKSENAFVTTTSVNNSPNLSATSSVNNSPEFSATSSEMPTLNKEKDSRLEQLGGNNPALVAFRELSSKVSKKLNISNGPNAKKIAGQLQRDLKEKIPDITHDKLVDAAMKHLENNLKDYEKMIVNKK